MIDPAHIPKFFRALGSERRQFAGKVLVMLPSSYEQSYAESDPSTSGDLTKQNQAVASIPAFRSETGAFYRMSRDEAAEMEARINQIGELLDQLRGFEQVNITPEPNLRWRG